MFLVVVGFATDVLGLYLISQGRANLIFYNLFLLVETSCVLYFFRKILKVKNIDRYILAGFILFAGYWSFLFATKGTKSFIDEAIKVGYFILLAFCIVFYYRQLKTLDAAPYTNRYFWIVTGYLVYIAGTFFLFSLLNNLTKEEQAEYYVLNFVFLFIKTVMFSIAMSMKSNPQPRKKFHLT
ncbi:hypothetical protein [Aridibaculum aurantiacum]|uniref:hypothetical protein n=1 Tax=Aridibaculum aurantiacum TaxID=2810307 RepID=UPI001A977BED|nr:hypothetical protein [Aridibaculum aurantiacum]